LRDRLEENEWWQIMKRINGSVIINAQAVQAMKRMNGIVFLGVVL
jgi:hypothetical protein